MHRFLFKPFLNLALSLKRQQPRQLLSWGKLSSFSFHNFQPFHARMSVAVDKLDSPEFKSVLTPELFSVAAPFEKHGYDLRIVGGAVRDILLGLQPKDVDLSTNATPERIIELLKEYNIRCIETGLQHGTITAHVNKLDFEVTTLRIDTETDGRHAKVQFTNDWKLDAERRDLTINAMSVGLNGTLYDYFGGREDLRQRRVRFVGDARSRIHEDYLRILRYFRFYGRISADADNHDPSTLNVIQETSDGLRNISVERVWMEVSKILSGNHAPSLVRLMYKLDVSQVIGALAASEVLGPKGSSFKTVCIHRGDWSWGEKDSLYRAVLRKMLEKAHMIIPKGLPDFCEERLEELTRAWKEHRKNSLQPSTLLCTLVNTAEEAENLAKQWKLSNAERAVGKFTTEHRQPKVHEHPLKPYQDMIVSAQNTRTKELLKDHIVELLHYQGRHDLAEEIERWHPPEFPITGQHLKALGVKSGPEFGKMLNKLKEVWKDGYFTASEGDLLDKARIMKEK